MMGVIDEARKWLGYLEHSSNDLLGIYTANVGKGGCTIFAQIIAHHYCRRNFSGLPWCAAFVHAVYIEALGEKAAAALLGKPHPGTRVMARQMRRRGCLRGRDYTPSPGDVIFLRSTPNGRISHCGIVEAVQDDTVVTIEGNTVDPKGRFPKELGGAVARRERKTDDHRIVGYADMQK